ncbi:prepilin-type N-terminal cleavage/methylation domain-containing protein [Clostridium botulinum]|nr:prepilin-type N-terminal cleavage/methylation domain-containing protein [Clostridium botulinum]NFP02378.1 prepilin-type N-terminal cleavage/methylation domain-containing protein [Clostridium botulinum]
MLSNKKRGFTLLELIIVMSLTLIILGMIFGIFNTNNKAMSDVNIKSTLQSEGQVIQETLSKIGMQASDMNYKNEDKDEIVIKSLKNVDENSEFILKKTGNELYISEEIVSNEDINEEWIKNNSKDYEKKLLTKNLKSMNMTKDNNSGKMEIILAKDRSYKKDEAIEYNINLKFVFRNKDNSSNND